MPSTDGFHRVRNIHQPSLTVFLPPKEKATGRRVRRLSRRRPQLSGDGSGGRQCGARPERNGDRRLRPEEPPGAHAGLPTTRWTWNRWPMRSAPSGMVRSRAREWNVDPAHVGIMGFSAGGELAAYAETRYDAGKPDAADAVERESSRPDFVVLAYPGGKAANLTVTQGNAGDLYCRGDRRQPLAQQHRLLDRAPQSRRPRRTSRLPPRRPRLRHDRTHSGVRQLSGRWMAGPLPRVDGGHGVSQMTVFAA